MGSVPATLTSSSMRRPDGDLLSPPWRSGDEPTGPLGRPVAAAMGVLAGLAVAALLTVVELRGLSLALLGLIVLAVPSAREASRGLLLNVAVLLGWLPILWWLPDPVGVGRSGAIAAAAVAGLTAWVLRGAPVRD